MVTVNENPLKPYLKKSSVKIIYQTIGLKTRLKPVHATECETLYFKLFY